MTTTNRQLKIHNTLTRNKEVFVPLHQGYVGMYVCGPTVSGESHLGHARPYVTFDVVFRYLQHLGYKVRYVRNITDAGHFEEEGQAAQDKVSEKAKLEQLEPMELVQKYTNLYHEAMQQLGCLRPTIEPTVTGHIVEQISMIEKIIEKGMAYVSEGSVYFDLEKYAASHDYGKLSGRVLDEMIAGSRELDGQQEKRHPADFALWKKAPAEHIMRWNSPWGEGFPGWHIECSAMATKYLGKQFDIHGGGMDLQFPHHESEIAQSCTHNGCTPVRYWMHNNMITVNGKKMGKSYNNTITLRELFSGEHPLLDQPYSPMTVRFLILQTHYRSTVDFSNEALQSAEKGYKRLLNAFQLLNKIPVPTQAEPALPAEDAAVIAICQNCYEHIDDDFNTAMVIADLFELAGKINSLYAKQIPPNALSVSTFALMKNTFQTFFTEILGLQNDSTANNNQLVDGLMELILKIRTEARTKKDWATSDLIRDYLNQLQVQVNDGKEGTTWSANN